MPIAAKLFGESNLPNPILSNVKTDCMNLEVA